MAFFIDLCPCLLTTKLSYAQLFKWGHSTSSHILARWTRAMNSLRSKCVPSALLQGHILKLKAELFHEFYDLFFAWILPILRSLKFSIKIDDGVCKGGVISEVTFQFGPI